MERKCWKCRKNLDDSIPIDGRIPFSATCDHCTAWLHCCCNCRHYQVGLPNNCRIPDTEPISDRENKNFCESFSPADAPPKEGPSIDEVSKRLFKDL